MLSKVLTACIQGIDAFPVTIETDISKGVGFAIVGLADTTVRESYERMQSALEHTGLRFPKARTIINLAPADVKKEEPLSTSPW